MADPNITQKTLGDNNQFTSRAKELLNNLEANIDKEYLKAVEGVYTEMVDALMPI